MRYQIGTILALAIVALGCGGGQQQGSTSAGGGAKVIDPSGNWTMTASDAGGNALHMAALFNQTGSTVTANSITAGVPPGCTPFSATFSNGTVQNVSQFSGTIAAGFGSFAFTGQLNDAGTHVGGTYSGLASGNCAGIAPSGTFTGDEVPSTSGSWTGTLQPCSWDGQTAICTPIAGSATAAVAFSLTQDDASGNVTGTYQVAGLAPFTSGAIGVLSADQDILSGLFWQFTMTDAAGSHAFIAAGQLNLARGFSGIVLDRSNDNRYQLIASH